MTRIPISDAQSPVRGAWSDLLSRPGCDAVMGEAALAVQRSLQELGTERLPHKVCDAVAPLAVAEPVPHPEANP